MMKKSILLLLCVTFTLYACNEKKYPELADGVYAEFITNHGTFVAKLYHDEVPLTVANFVDLAQGSNALVDSSFSDKPFYNGLIFHRVISNFMIQGGDPQGDGRGGPGYRFPDEFSPDLKHHKEGILSMANSGPDTNGSQFFITLKDTPHLDQRHSVFGEIVIGMDVVEAIGNLPTGPNDRPEEDVVMQEVNIINKGNIKLDAFEKQIGDIEKERKATEARVEEVKAATRTEMEGYQAQAKEYDSGLKIHFLKQGDGPKPQEGENILMHYEGYLADGSLFDTSVLEIAEKYEIVNEQRKAQNGYTPMPTPYSKDAGLIAGFKEGMLEMKTGDQAVLFIPSHLGYGPQGAGNVIPPDADLIFRVEIVPQQQ